MEFLQKYGLLLIVGLIVLICAGFMLLRMRRLRRRSSTWQHYHMTKQTL